MILAALNGLDLQAADIENAYLTAPCREKCYTIVGQEFGDDCGSIFIITKALYGLRSSGAAFRAFLAGRLDIMGFKSSIVDPDVWLWPGTKPDGEEYYEYILVYVDDILCISYKPKETIGKIQERFKFKKDKIAPPDFYLGGKVQLKGLNGINIWTITSTDYVKAAVENLEKQLGKKGLKLPSAVQPMATGFVPELDDSPELDAGDHTTVQELIGILRWAIELGRVDICHEVSILSQFQASPRQGHLEQLYHIFGFLKKNPKLTLYFDPNEPKLDESVFENGSTAKDFKEQYQDAEEELPTHMPKPRGKAVRITAFFDASHAANKVTRRSHTGFVIFVNRAPIIWYSKRQNTVKASTFLSDFLL